MPLETGICLTLSVQNSDFRVLLRLCNSLGFMANEETLFLVCIQIITIHESDRISKNISQQINLNIWTTNDMFVFNNNKKKIPSEIKQRNISDLKRTIDIKPTDILLNLHSNPRLLLLIWWLLIIRMPDPLHGSLMSMWRIKSYANCHSLPNALNSIRFFALHLRIATKSNSFLIKFVMAFIFIFVCVTWLLSNSTPAKFHHYLFYVKDSSGMSMNLSEGR